MSDTSTFARLRSLCPTLSAGILAAEQMKLGAELDVLEQAGIGLVHFDVMDGCFCPQMTVGAGYVGSLRTPLLKDVHLMLREPLDQLSYYVAAGADIVTVHVEAAVHIHRVLQRLGSMEHSAGPGRGIVRGLALNPGTPLDWLAAPLLEETELICLLAIDPGWPGQEFAPFTLERVARVKEIIRVVGKDILVCVDGGVTRDNLTEVATSGVDLIVTGSAIFAGGKAAENARYMLDAMRKRPAS
jgi:ribulose-phosphate 3-epimerase